jgi:predicted patatin/cPLA2 family phospholipase
MDTTKNPQNQAPNSAICLPDAWFFKNYDPDDAQQLSRNIARASSAAPTYFNPTRFGKFKSLVDGGFAANAPGMSALAEAMNVAKPGDDFLVVMLGTGYRNQAYPYWGLRFRPKPLWIQPALELYSGMMTKVVQYQLSTILNKQVPNSVAHAGVDPLSRPQIRFLNLDAQMTPAMDAIDNIDPKNVQGQIDLAYRTVDANLADVEKMAKELVRQYRLRMSGTADHMVYTILANTGGGERGIYTAVLADILSQMTGLHPTQMFWMNAGNSAGALNTCLQTAPAPDGSPLYSTSDGVRIWKEALPIIFKTSWWHKVGQYVGLGAKYPNAGIEDILLQYLGDTKFGSHIGKVMCPAVVTDQTA